MAREQQRETLRGSILDRLTGANGAATNFGAITLSDLKTALRRDLQWLLNSRVWLPDDYEHYEEIPSSQLVYGVPDFTSYSWKSTSHRKEICRVVEDALRNFEPRLLARTIRVSSADEDEDEPNDLFVKLRIDGVLNVEPYSEPISFDTEVEIATGAIKVKEA